MFRVSNQQLGMIGYSLAIERFENDMVVHLREFAPRHSEVIGDSWTRRTIQLGIQRARAYGVTNLGLLQFYVELMFMFGSMFDTDPLLPWGGKVLRDPNISDEIKRTDRLYDAMLLYLDIVDGPGRRFTVQALRRLRQFLLEDIPVTDLVVERKVLDLMMRVYPERCAYLGEQLLLQFIRGRAELAARYKMATDQGSALVIGMSFAIGHGFAEDPLYPWVQATLCDPTITDPERRVARLRTRVEIYLDRALKYIDGRRSDEL